MKNEDRKALVRLARFERASLESVIDTYHPKHGGNARLLAAVAGDTPVLTPDQISELKCALSRSIAYIALVSEARTLGLDATLVDGGDILTKLRTVLTSLGGAA